MAQQFYGRVIGVDLDVRKVTLRITDAHEGITEDRIRAIAKAMIGADEVILTIGGSPSEGDPP